jgi:glutamine synthetase
MMAGSELFSGAAVEGVGQAPQDDELSVHPDLEAVTRLPWMPGGAGFPVLPRRALSHVQP